MPVSTDPTSAAVGDTLPPFTRFSDLANWNRYAAVNDEFVPIHMDDEAGKEAGFPTAFSMGNLAWSYLHNAVRDWLSDSGRIVTMSCQFRSPMTRKLTVTANGKVTGRRTEGDEVLLDLELWVEDADGGLLTPGAATVALGAPA